MWTFVTLATIGILLPACSVASGLNESHPLNLEELKASEGFLGYFTPFGIPSMTWTFLRFMGDGLLTKGLKYNSNQHFY